MKRSKFVAACGAGAISVVLMATPALAANYQPASGQARLCGYTQFTALGADNVFHRYTHQYNSSVPGGGREATWLVQSINSVGTWYNVGYTGRTC